ncbi:putative ATPase [Promicromonospora umidemergens]|uniref:AAA family ATPase n=1 Tax=Promicromonospora umidemergens TaxID=629679 RepID=A0ABP8WG90_9MICO|nr:AAA family ATPase [Promicromonospora umidemergens]MCP2284016.1 putative ATPase [Promicromonospora umidemergens]
MLTHLEVDGFKNLLDFSVDFGPFTCIAGPNAIGKSNVFDAIQFLSSMADKTFVEAASELRTPGTPAADLASLFWAGANEGARMRFGAEFIVDRHVQDDFGRDANPTATFLRYDLELQYVAAADGIGVGGDRMRLIREELGYITLGDAAKKIPWEHSKQAFRDAVLMNRRRGSAYISTTEDEGVRIINVHQDGGSRGQTRKSPAARAPRTVMSTTTTSDDPTVLAARREMQGWRNLALEPSALRRPDNVTDPDVMTENGEHMPAALRRIAARRGPDALAAVTASAAALTDVRSVDVDIDPQRQTLTLRASIRSGPDLPARSLSDGTLRFLALSIMANDPDYTGLICMEEPENGIHPARIEVMADLVRGIAVDPDEAPGDDNPMRQVVVNTHSPRYVEAQHAADLLFAENATVMRDGRRAATLRLLPLRGTWRDSKNQAALTQKDIQVFLESDEETQLRLDLGLVEQ